MGLISGTNLYSLEIHFFVLDFVCKMHLIGMFLVFMFKRVSSSQILLKLVISSVYDILRVPKVGL